jgi:hypothetical protein
LRVFGSISPVLRVWRLCVALARSITLIHERLSQSEFVRLSVFIQPSCRWLLSIVNEYMPAILAHLVV